VPVGRTARSDIQECWELNHRVVELEDRALAYYVEVMRALRRRFGDEVLDVAEALRRADGQMAGQQRRARLSEDSPRAAIHAHLEDLSDANWSRKLACVFCMPSEDRLELVAMHCPVGVAFRRMREPELGLAWCAYDFGYTSALGGGHVALLEPRHYHLGHAYCFQIHEAIRDPEVGRALMAPEITGWRRYARVDDEESPMGEMPARARFFPDAGVDEPMYRKGLEERIATLKGNGVRGFVRLVRTVADRFGEAAFDEVETIFAAEGVSGAELRSPSPPQLRGWYWSD
jgi:hypothetical protein